MGILKDILAMTRDDCCDGCRKPLTECNYACPEAAAVSETWFHETK